MGVEQGDDERGIGVERMQGLISGRDVAGREGGRAVQKRWGGHDDGGMIALLSAGSAPR